MNYTKGEWWAEFIQVPNKQQWEIRAKTEHPLLQHIADMGKPTDGSKAEANAHLIAAAVNACISVNPDNPLAVAESIKDMYEALLYIKKLLENHIYKDADVVEFGGSKLSAEREIVKVLAKAKGKEAKDVLSV